MAEPDRDTPALGSPRYRRRARPPESSPRLLLLEDVAEVLSTTRAQIGLMLGGIALLGVVTASIASWPIGRVRDAEASAEVRLNRHLEAIQTKIAELKDLIASGRIGTDPSERSSH